MRIRANWAAVCLCLLAATTLLADGSFAERLSVGALRGDRRPVPPTLFALNIVNLEHGASWPAVRFSAWRNFHSAWGLVEPRQGGWAFEQLDRDVARAKREQVESLLELVSTPDWAAVRPGDRFASEPRDFDDWRTYVRTVATRYQGRVQLYELWNEPNVVRSYSGSIENLVGLSKVAYETLKTVDPSITVVSPAFSTCCGSLVSFERFLAAGGGEYADVIGFHFYVAPRAPESMIAWVADVRRLLRKYGLSQKPLWNTEMGWKIENRHFNPPGEDWAGAALSNEMASAYLARSYILSWAVGVERLFWYAWGHNSMGLTEFGGKNPKPVAKAYNVIQGWLQGARMTSLTQDNQGAWICQFRRADGRPGWLVWCTAAPRDWVLPATWRAGKVSGLTGEQRVLPAIANLSGRAVPVSIRIGPSPIFFEP